MTTNRPRAASPKRPSATSAGAQAAKTRQPQVRDTSVSTKAADAQRAQVRTAILREAEDVRDLAYAEGMALMHQRTDPREIVARVGVHLREADRIEATAARFAPIQRTA